MSARKDLRSDLIAKIVAALDPAVTVAKWSGEEAGFHQNRTWPAVFVGYAGADLGEDQEIGPAATTYERQFYFQVFVATEKSGGTDGDDAAMDLLEDIEESLSGQEIAGMGPAELTVGGNGMTEELVFAHLGRFLYVQHWRVSDLESH